jgi:hypothetical protein
VRVASVPVHGALLVLAALELLPARLGAEPPAAHAVPSPIDSVKTLKRPERSFLPKYSPEWFLGLGYSGTFMSLTRQWPTLVFTGEVLFARPGKFDFGSYLELRLGRPDEHEGAFEVGLGPELMWRAWESAIYDIAPVVRGAYLLDTAEPGNPLIRGGVGVQVSLFRSLAVLGTYDPLFSIDRVLTNGGHFANGFSLTLKGGVCITGGCRQIRRREIKTIDRSAVACRDAALVCETARRGSETMSAELCRAAQDALDPFQYPAAFGDPVGAFLDALRKEEPSDLNSTGKASLQTLIDDHAVSIRAIDEYAERIRHLGPGETLSAQYAYLVTPSMVRDWLGCDVTGKPIACASTEVCANDTGAASK